MFHLATSLSVQISYHPAGAFETPCHPSGRDAGQVLDDGHGPGSQSCMWIHRSSQFYRNYKGIHMTDRLSQYHLVDKKLPGVTNANYRVSAVCPAHARRDYTDAVKAACKKDPPAGKRSVAYQALSQIASIYKLKEALKNRTLQERLQGRQTTKKPLVEEYFAWTKQA